MIQQFVGDPSFTAVLMVGTIALSFFGMCAGAFAIYQEMKKEKKNEGKNSCCANHRTDGNSTVPAGPDYVG